MMEAHFKLTSMVLAKSVTGVAMKWIASQRFVGMGFALSAMGTTRVLRGDGAPHIS